MGGVSVHDLWVLCVVDMRVSIICGVGVWMTCERVRMICGRVHDLPGMVLCP